MHHFIVNLTAFFTYLFLIIALSTLKLMINNIIITFFLQISYKIPAKLKFTMLIKTQNIEMQHLLLILELLQLTSHSEMVVFFNRQIKLCFCTIQLHNISVAFSQIFVRNTIGNKNKRLLVVGDGTYFFGFIFQVPVVTLFTNS